MKKLQQTYRFFFRKHRKKSLAALAICLIFYWFCLPKPLFNDPYCLVIEDNSGELLGAHIASDGQWRFPSGDSLPDKFIRAIVEFEDKRFFNHPGIDFLGLLRAFRQNISQGRIVSGGSTISMQTIRLARKPKSRNLYQKVIEMILATRLELRYQKREILNYYAAHAPFGGNVVGLEAASWRYFGKSPYLLSWGEAAMLAVLPNSPGLIHPGRNRTALKNKRDRLLDRLQKRGVIDALSCQLAKEESLPEKPHPLPRLAPHFMDWVGKKHNYQGRIKSTLNKELQIRNNELVKRHQAIRARNEIHNMAAVVIEVETGAIVSYVGNVIDAGKNHGEQVDIIPAPRSSGSILKPILYALALQEGAILPESLIPDIPMHLGNYRPENFNEKYDGVVSAKTALIRSLNVPMVYLLQEYGLEKFHHELKQIGLSTINKSAEHYGLPLILGGAEVSLLDITNVYAGMARTLGQFYNLSGQYRKDDFRPVSYLANKGSNPGNEVLLKEAPRISASAAWFTFEAMQKVERPNSEGEWEYFQSSQQIAWKTGTSFGFRDAWAVGITTKYAVGVWAGNADGEGRPGLVGVKVAAPLLFDIFQLLEASNWFNPPYDEMAQLPICTQSGYRPNELCTVDTVWVPLGGLKAKPCPYHQRIHLDESKQWQVNSDCESPSAMRHEAWFVLPPVEEYYYKSKNPTYQSLPPWRKDCTNELVASSTSTMQLIYPEAATKIYVPIDLDGQLSRTVFSLAHRRPETTVHWHIDNEFIGSTKTFHNLELRPEAGSHLLVVVDEYGNRLEQSFEIIGKEE